MHINAAGLAAAQGGDGDAAAGLQLQLHHSCIYVGCAHRDNQHPCKLCHGALAPTCGDQHVQQRIVKGETVLPKCEQPLHVVYTPAGAATTHPSSVTCVRVYALKQKPLDHLLTAHKNNVPVSAIHDAPDSPIIPAPFSGTSNDYVERAVSDAHRTEQGFSMPVSDSEARLVLNTSSGNQGSSNLVLMVVACGRDSTGELVELDDLLPALSNPFWVVTSGKVDHLIFKNDPVKKVQGLGAQAFKSFKDLPTLVAKALDRDADKEDRIAHDRERISTAFRRSANTIETVAELDAFFKVVLDSSSYLTPEKLCAPTVMKLGQDKWNEAMEQVSAMLEPIVQLMYLIQLPDLPGCFLRLLYTTDRGKLHLDRGPSGYEAETPEGLRVLDAHAAQQWLQTYRVPLTLEEAHQRARQDWGIFNDTLWHTNWSRYRDHSLPALPTPQSLSQSLPYDNLPTMMSMSRSEPQQQVPPLLSPTHSQGPQHQSLPLLPPTHSQPHHQQLQAQSASGSFPPPSPPQDLMSSHPPHHPHPSAQQGPLSPHLPYPNQPQAHYHVPTDPFQAPPPPQQQYGLPLPPSAELPQLHGSFPRDPAPQAGYQVHQHDPRLVPTAQHQHQHQQTHQQLQDLQRVMHTQDPRQPALQQQQQQQQQQQGAPMAAAAMTAAMTAPNFSIHDLLRDDSDLLQSLQLPPSIADLLRSRDGSGALPANTPPQLASLLQQPGGWQALLQSVPGSSAAMLLPPSSAAAPVTSGVPGGYGGQAASAGGAAAGPDWGARRAAPAAGAGPHEAVKEEGRMAGTGAAAGTSAAVLGGASAAAEGPSGRSASPFLLHPDDPRPAVPASCFNNMPVDVGGLFDGLDETDDVLGGGHGGGLVDSLTALNLAGGDIGGYSWLQTGNVSTADAGNVPTDDRPRVGQKRQDHSYRLNGPASTEPAAKQAQMRD